MIAIIDFGVSNVASVANMIKKVGSNSIIIKNHNDIKNNEITKLILPGVGSYDSAMTLLNEGGWIDELNSFVKNPGNILFGICLGMQLLLRKSEEGKLPGLGLIQGSVKKFVFSESKYKIPHMGWNIVNPKNKNKLFDNMSKELRFYFVHSYYVNCDNQKDISATCHYGIDFTCAIEKDNILGVQFHPEKSHRFGMELMKKFIEL